MKSVISLTQSAIHQCLKIKNIHQATALRLSVKSGGCNGFQYQFKPTNQPKDKNDEVYTDPTKKLIIHVCGTSLLHLLGSQIDWQKDIMGEAFHFNNPNATTQCGCGTSFNSIN